jgi:hypothetical protein
LLYILSVLACYGPRTVGIRLNKEIELLLLFYHYDDDDDDDDDGHHHHHHHHHHRDNLLADYISGPCG